MRDLRKVLPLVAAALAACGEGPRAAPNPLDRFAFPNGLAALTLPSGKPALVVVSSNFDLRYSPEEGGSVIVVDPAESRGDRLAILGRAAVGSFTGEVALVDPQRCPGQPRQVLVASRNSNALYRVTLGDDGSLECGPGCRVDLGGTVGDPYSVAVACRSSGGTSAAEAYVTHLRTLNDAGIVSRIDLATGARTLVDLGPTPAQSLAYDPLRDRLLATGRFVAIDSTPLRWLDLAFASAASTQNLASSLRGAELASIALSNDGTRAYVAVRLFDRDVSASLGGRSADVGGALAVLDVADLATGNPAARLVRVVPVGLGPGDVKVFPARAGRRDLVAVTSTTESKLLLYDDDVGQVVRAIGRDEAGATVFGREPFGIAIEPQPRADGTVRVYVASFDRGFVVPVEVNLSQPSLARVLQDERFGPEVP